MSISNLLVENLDIVHANDLISDFLDTYDARPLDLGTTTCNRVNIGTLAHTIPLYINGVLFKNGADLIIQAPIAATDNNGITVNNTTHVIKMEFADATHEGIMSIADQTFGGTKHFPTGISVSGALAGTVNILNEYYLSSSTINCQWDPTGALFAAPLNTTLSCERIGKMIFITILSTQSAFPVGTAIITSTVGVVPVAFRPSLTRYSNAQVINGFVAVSPEIQRVPPFNTYVGTASLDNVGTLRFGTQIPNSGSILTDNSLFNFQGPNTCGIFTQTLIFSV